MDQLSCPVCNTPIQSTFFFCPNCGKILQQPPLSTSVGKQILIYSISFFLPPFGLSWAFKYLKQKDEKAKIIGWVAIILTVLSIIITIVIFKGFMDSYAAMLNGIGTGTSNPQMLQQLKSL